jgi:prepilin-type processing-associated H-X9-DG protein
MIQAMLARQAEMTGEEIPDPIEMIAMMTGVNLETDIVDHLGTRFGWYLSDRTGGGGLLSAVSFVEVTNEEALRETFGRLTGMANAMAEQNAKGYVRFARREVGGRPVMVLMFPGLPIPLEISFAISDGYMYSALSVSGLVAAMDQAQGGQPSLADNPRFQEMGGLELDQAIQLTFLDTPRTMRDGYGLVSLGMAALTNMTRSPADPERGVFGSMPSFDALTDGAKAMVEVISIEDADLVVRSQSDRSALVNACGIIGMLGGSTGAVAVAAIGAGVMLPALRKARENAERVKRAAQYQELGMGVMMFAVEHDDRVPESVEELIREGYLTPESLLSPLGGAPDGGPDLWLNSEIGRLSSVRRPDRHILAYDRAMLLAGSDTVVVLFVDGHVEMQAPHELKALMMEAHHDGTDFEAEHHW